MSETIRASVSAVKSTTRQLSTLLGSAIHRLGGAILTQSELLGNLVASHIDPTSVARLLVLHDVLEMPELSSFGSEVALQLKPTTVATLGQLDTLVSTGQVTSALTSARVNAALRDLTTSTQTTYQKMVQRETQQVGADLRAILDSRGYRVDVIPASAGQMMWLRATRAEHVVAAQLGASGTLELDFAGFDSGDCTKERGAIIEQLAQRGYTINVESTIAHNRRDGGSVLQTIEQGFASIDDQLRRLNLAKAHHHHHRRQPR